jgi:8-oxo-dGTP pyrophosphatase MutT (NUDIX family)
VRAIASPFRFGQSSLLSELKLWRERLMRPTVFPIHRLSLRFVPRPWSFAIERRNEIDAHFARARRERPQLWNGQVLMMHRHRVEDGVLAGDFLETDFASFMTWRDWGFPETGVTNCFSMGALRASDGAWIMGVMGPHTSAAGRIYFPAGTPDLDDIADGMVDLSGSVVREVYEETGLQSDDFAAQSGWHCVIDGARIALMKVLQAHMPAKDVRQRILDHLARTEMPELADARIVYSQRDLDPMMPRFVVQFLDHMGFDNTRS